MFEPDFSKITGDALLVALGHDADNNKSNARNTASLFDRTLKGLKDGDADLEYSTSTDCHGGPVWLSVVPASGTITPGGANRLDATIDALAEIVPIEPRPFRLLHYLVRHRDRLVSKEELLDVDTVARGELL